LLQSIPFSECLAKLGAGQPGKSKEEKTTPAMPAKLAVARQSSIITGSNERRKAG
jgi:hypothetical protein